MILFCIKTDDLFENTYLGIHWALGDSLGPRARAHRSHSFVGPKGPGPIGPFLGESFGEVIGFNIFQSKHVIIPIYIYIYIYQRGGNTVTLML